MMYVQVVAIVSLTAITIACLLHVANLAPFEYYDKDSYRKRINPIPFAIVGILAASGIFTLPYAFGWVG